MGGNCTSLDDIDGYNGVLAAAEKEVEMKSSLDYLLQYHGLTEKENEQKKIKDVRLFNSLRSLCGEEVLKLFISF